MAPDDGLQPESLVALLDEGVMLLARLQHLEQSYDTRAVAETER